MASSKKPSTPARGTNTPGQKGRPTTGKSAPAKGNKKSGR